MARYDDEQGTGGELEPLAVVDIGSNSVRLVVYEGAVRSPTPLFNEKVLAGLGRGVATSGRLGTDAVERALEALRRFAAIARVLGVKNVRAIATAACREASNGPEFLARAEKALGVRIQVVSGEQEAELAAMGILMGFEAPDGIVADMGGGSLELIDLVGRTRRDGVTLPLGGLRLIDTSGARLDKAAEIVDQHIGRIGWTERGAGRALYAVGGTWRALAKLHMEQARYPLRVMHGYALPAREVIEFCEGLRKAKRHPAIEEVSRARREVLPYGALVLERIVRHIRPREVVFSVFGIREGVVYKLLSEAERRKDPLLAFATDYARLRSRSLAHAQELCEWTDRLFEGAGPKETPEERRLRHAACLLSDIGWRAHPDYRGEQSLNVIAHAALGGIDHSGRAFLAHAVYFRHVGLDDDEGEEQLSVRLKALISKRQVKRARVIGAAIRSAHMLSIGRPGIIDETKLAYEGDRLVLTVPRAYMALDGERLRRRFGTLAGLLDAKPEVRIGR